jgi:hypothetical protein
MTLWYFFRCLKPVKYYLKIYFLILSPARLGVTERCKKRAWQKGEGEGEKVTQAKKTGTEKCFEARRWLGKEKKKEEKFDTIKVSQSLHMTFLLWNLKNRKLLMSFHVKEKKKGERAEQSKDRNHQLRTFSGSSLVSTFVRGRSIVN